MSMSMSMSKFNATLLVSDGLDRLIVSVAEDFAERAVSWCARHYNFDASEALSMLGMNNIKVVREVSKSNSKSKSKAVASFPLPFNGEMNVECCYALRQNNGLYTQCQVTRKGDAPYCKSCQALADKSDNGIPEYGTIQNRIAVDVLEYVDPKGRKPVAYTKVMKKYKLTQEQVLEEAGKLNIIINEKHFVAPEDTKRGRPASEKVPKEPKGVKGRPKKAKKVLQIGGEEDDLFASLVAEANAEAEAEAEAEANGEEELVIANKENEVDKHVEKEAKKKADEEAKEAKKKADEEAKEAKKKAVEEAKEAKKKAVEEAKEAKKKADEEAKEAKRLAGEQAKKEKEDKKKADEEAKKDKGTKKDKETKKDNEDDEQQQDVVKKIEIDGKKYLKSKNTGVIYDYIKYAKEGEQVVIGKWNDSLNKIDFVENDEESEEEYEE